MPSGGTKDMLWWLVHLARRIHGWNAGWLIREGFDKVNVQSGTPDNRESTSILPLTEEDNVFPVRDTRAFSVSTMSKYISLLTCLTPARRHGIGLVKGFGAFDWPPRRELSSEGGVTMSRRAFGEVVNGCPASRLSAMS